MARKGLVPLFTAVVLVATASGLAQPRECRDWPVLYSDDSFRGRSFTLRESVSDLHRLGMGDDASSLCVPAGWGVVLYEDTNFRGDVLELSGPYSISDLKRQRPQGRDWGDRISSARVTPPRRRVGRYDGRLPRECDQHPVIFQKDSFAGSVARLDRSIPDLHRLGMGDDASSICVPDGWRVVVFEDKNYRGDRLELYGPDAIQDLKRDRPGGRDWGDRISSAQVERTGGYRRRPSESGGIFKGSPGDQRAACDRYPLLFEAYDFQGRSLSLNDSVPDLRRAGLGNSTGSLCVPAGWTVSFYEYSDYRGRSFEVSGRQEIADLRRSRQSSSYWGDQLGSVRVIRGRDSGAGFGNDRYDRSSRDCPDYPVLFSDHGFGGERLELTGPIEDLDSAFFGDSASSVCVPTGWTVILYEHANFRGDYLELSGGRSVADLKRDAPGGRDWGDRASSVDVRRPWR